VRAFVLLCYVVAATVLGTPGTAQALLCTSSEKPGPRFGDAMIALEGVALSGPERKTGLITPARILVTRYLKGNGPDVARVATGTYELGATAGAFSPRAGDLVRVVGDRGREDRSIFGGLAPDVIATRVCDPDTTLLDQARGPHGPADDRLLFRARRAGALLGLAAG